jgi:uncharacterized membrane protein YbaN (DUF454 family)
MDEIKRAIWFCLGMICLGVSYIGIVTPGIPWSTPAVGAAYCFAKSSKRWHDYIMYHPVFGTFLRNWTTKRVFPKYGKWAMIVTMDLSLIILWLTTQNWKLVAGVGLVMLICAIWAWRYPDSEDEYYHRITSGKKIGWFK